MFFLVFLVVLASANAKNILIVSSIPSPSHHIYNYAFAKGLMDKGHNITMLDSDAKKNDPTNLYHPIQIEGIYGYLEEKFSMEEVATSGLLGSIQTFGDFANVACEYIYESPALTELLNYPKDYKFDLMVIDVAMGKCLHPLIQRFNYPPTIAITAYLLPQINAMLFGGSPNTAYIPSPFLRYTNEMSFTERLINFLVVHFDFLYHELIVDPQQEQFYQKKIGSHYQSNDVLDKHISLFLANFDPVLSYPQAVPPNIIPVGGLHARPSKPLPKDIEEILHKAKAGVIVFSLGTNVRSDQLENSTKQAFLQAFSKLPHTILWKFESDFTDLPPNVVVRKWLPVNDLLGRKEVKLFLSHGGALSTQEAIYHGVPVLGIPFFVDQFVNVNSMIKKGVADSLNIFDVSAEEISQKIKKLLSPEYTERMAKVSRRYKDQPQTALERAVFWAEYAMRHNGSEFLAPQSRQMNFIQASNYDLIVVLVLIVQTVLFGAIYCIRKVLKCFRKTKVKKE